MSLGLMKYKRVAQRLREKFNDKSFKMKDVEDAIFIECGTDPRTVKSALEKMNRLELIEEINKNREFGVMNTREFKLTEAQNEYF
ncbi:hypothetical protein KAR91_46780 [Candidatus Pacearchaeota archaeon]|nr:hypothetical protein [Candidatus Pacearchaeota archaeon]